MPEHGEEKAFKEQILCHLVCEGKSLFLPDFRKSVLSNLRCRGDVMIRHGIDSAYPVIERLEGFVLFEIEACSVTLVTRSAYMTYYQKLSFHFRVFSLFNFLLHREPSTLLA